MTRDDLLALLSAWGWSQTGWANRGHLGVWKKGRHTVHTVRVPMRGFENDAEMTELLEGAVYDLAIAEAPRLLAVVREVAALHQPEEWPRGLGEMVCRCCRNHPYPCPTATALTPLTEGETDGS